MAHEHQITIGVPGVCVSGVITIEDFLCPERDDAKRPYKIHASAAYKTWEQIIETLDRAKAYCEAELDKVLVKESKEQGSAP